MIVTMIAKDKMSIMTAKYDEIKKRMLVLNVQINDIEEIQGAEKTDREREDKKSNIERRDRNKISEFI